MTRGQAPRADFGISRAAETRRRGAMVIVHEADCVDALRRFVARKAPDRFTIDAENGIVISLFPSGFSLSDCTTGLEACKTRNLLRDDTAGQLAAVATCVAEGFGVPLSKLYALVFPTRKYAAREALNSMIFALPLIAIKMPCSAALGSQRYVVFERTTAFVRTEDVLAFAAAMRQLGPAPEKQKLPITKEVYRLMQRLATSIGEKKRMAHIVTAGLSGKRARGEYGAAYEAPLPPAPPPSPRCTRPPCTPPCPSLHPAHATPSPTATFISTGTQPHDPATLRTAPPCTA